MKIVFATGNPHKVDEVNQIAKNSGIEFILPPEGFNPQETGKTFAQNSMIKAKEAHRLSGMISLADDSGLCVEALDGAPGLYSARYAGTQEEKIKKLLNEMEGVENRFAKFVCCMTLLDDNGELLFQTTGECHGSIIEEAKGIHGFGYDPVFKVSGTNFTMAQMSDAEKNMISHRANALNSVINFLKNIIQNNKKGSL